MFIEKRQSSLFLSQKFLGKKFTVALDNEAYTETELDLLSEKIFGGIEQMGMYHDFYVHIHHPQALEYVMRANIQYKNLSESIYPARQYEQYEDFPIAFIYESNKTEGSRIPHEEVEKIIREKKYTHKVKNEIQEVKNSIRAWRFLERDFRFNLTSIKRLYHILTTDLLQENGQPYPRGFKKVRNVVNNRNTTDPDQVENALIELLTWYKESKTSIFPIQMAFDFHLRFEQIHPFENGNGRIGRMLMNKILIASGFLPFIIFSDNRQAFFSALASADNNQRKKYYTFLLEQYQKSIEYFQ